MVVSVHLHVYLSTSLIWRITAVIVPRLCLTISYLCWLMSFSNAVKSIVWMEWWSWWFPYIIVNNDVDLILQNDFYYYFLFIVSKCLYTNCATSICVVVQSCPVCSFTMPDKSLRIALSHWRIGQHWNKVSVQRIILLIMLAPSWTLKLNMFMIEFQACLSSKCQFLRSMANRWVNPTPLLATWPANSNWTVKLIWKRPCPTCTLITSTICEMVMDLQSHIWLMITTKLVLLSLIGMLPFFLVKVNEKDDVKVKEMADKFLSDNLAPHVLLVEKQLKANGTGYLVGSGVSINLSTNVTNTFIWKYFFAVDFSRHRVLQLHVHGCWTIFWRKSFGRCSDAEGSGG